MEKALKVVGPRKPSEEGFLRFPYNSLPTAKDAIVPIAYGCSNWYGGL